ncbi:streptophobe family protein [Streptomyces xantholiticus]|uniref:streptophobe family protein n=1 Tax=Streptomyces xantholiticus TaxID=68285 RepID=UPI00357145C9
MSQQAPSSPGSATRPAHGWPHALASVLAGLAVMAACAALGLWAAGAADLPDGGFLPVLPVLPVLAALVVMAAGGTVEVAGDAGVIAETSAGCRCLGAGHRSDRRALGLTGPSAGPGGPAFSVTAARRRPDRTGRARRGGSGGRWPVATNSCTGCQDARVMDDDVAQESRPTRYARIGSVTV